MNAQQRDDPRSFGETLRRMRKLSGMKSYVVAAGVGISVFYYSRIENDVVVPKPELIVDIARTIGANPVELLRASRSLGPGMLALLKD